MSAVAKRWPAIKTWRRTDKGTKNPHFFLERFYLFIPYLTQVLFWKPNELPQLFIEHWRSFRNRLSRTLKNRYTPCFLSFLLEPPRRMAAFVKFPFSVPIPPFYLVQMSQDATSPGPLQKKLAPGPSFPYHGSVLLPHRGTLWYHSLITKRSFGQFGRVDRDHHSWAFFFGSFESGAQCWLMWSEFSISSSRLFWGSFFFFFLESGRSMVACFAGTFVIVSLFWSQMSQVFYSWQHCISKPGPFPSTSTSNLNLKHTIFSNIKNQEKRKQRCSRSFLFVEKKCLSIKRE